MEATKSLGKCCKILAKTCDDLAIRNDVDPVGIPQLTTNQHCACYAYDRAINASLRTGSGPEK